MSDFIQEINSCIFIGEKIELNEHIVCSKRKIKPMNPMEQKVSPIINKKEFKELLAKEFEKPMYEITEEDLIFEEEQFDENEIIPGEEEWNDWPPKEQPIEQVGITFLPPYNIRELQDVNKWELKENENALQHPELVNIAREKLAIWIQKQLKDIKDNCVNDWINQELQDRINSLDVLG